MYDLDIGSKQCGLRFLKFITQTLLLSARFSHRSKVDRFANAHCRFWIPCGRWSFSTYKPSHRELLSLEFLWSFSPISSLISLILWDVLILQCFRYKFHLYWCAYMLHHFHDNLGHFFWPSGVVHPWLGLSFYSGNVNYVLYCSGTKYLRF